jgi:lysophospholipase L1-like esterase
MIRAAAAAAAIAATVLAVVVVAAPAPARAESEALFRQNDRVAFVGNTFAERLDLYGRFETVVLSRLPSLGLTFRNLGWSADTPREMPRPLNFGDVHSHLELVGADVILLFFGMSESFAGEAGLEAFERDLADFVGELAERRYGGDAPPRLALVSPIPHERHHRAGLPDPRPHNRDLALYVEAMRRVAAAKRIPFADLFTPLSTLMATSGDKERLTINGIHLGDTGDWVVSNLLAEALGVPAPPPERIEIDVAAGTVEATGDATASLAEFAGASAAFRLRQDALPPPPPPAGTAPWGPIAERFPEVVVRGLPPGVRATLAIDGIPVATADAESWAAGIRVADGPLFDGVERLRAAVIDKAREFFLRYRAVNGEYIYGRRKEPFGVVNFPSEMSALDRLAESGDADCLRLATERSLHVFTIRPAPPGESKAPTPREKQ